jgi:hypothetical protein
LLRHSVMFWGVDQEKLSLDVPSTGMILGGSCYLAIIMTTLVKQMLKGATLTCTIETSLRPRKVRRWLRADAGGDWAPRRKI